MQDLGYELPRKSIPRTRVNKGQKRRARLLLLPFPCLHIPVKRRPTDTKGLADIRNRQGLISGHVPQDLHLFMDVCTSRLKPLSYVLGPLGLRELVRRLQGHSRRP
jgi:hypothetical protein